MFAILLRQNLYNAILFNCGWFVCVLGGDIPAIAAAIILLLVHWNWFAEDLSEWLVIFFCAAIGTSADILLELAGVIRFEKTLLPFPVWLACLWLVFSTTLGYALAYLKNRLVLASCFGAFAAPLSYIAGIKFGAASTDLSLFTFAAIYAVLWAILLPALLSIHRYVVR